MMTKFWSGVVRELTPYIPGEQTSDTNIIKLNTNENPYGPSPKVIAAIRAATDDTLRRYPDPEAAALKAAVASWQGIGSEQVFVGNGSDEVLAHAFHALLKHERPILFPDITYSFYPVYCGLYGIGFEQIPLTSDFEIDVNDYARDNAGVILPNPNAPTGRALPLTAIEALLRKNRESVVVVDEAYVAFGANSAVELIGRYDNLLVIQTLSKSHSLAGLRVGFALGQSSLIEALERVKNSFNSYPLDRLAIAGAVAAVEDRAYLESTRGRVIATRERLRGSLSELGFEIVPSAANFLFVTHHAHPAAELARALRERAILVRHFDTGRTAQYLRITIGTDAEIETLVSVLRDLV